MTLPKMPPAAVDEHNLQGGRLMYSYEQMLAWRLACYRAGLLRAAEKLQAMHAEQVGSATEHNYYAVAAENLRKEAQE